MPGTFPLSSNTIIPLFENSAHLTVSYGRNPKSYALNKYSAQRAVKSVMGTYLKLDPKDAHRVVNDSLWAAGTTRESQPLNKQGFTTDTFYCQRYNYSVQLDGLAIDLADFDVTKVHTEKLARIAMINRTKRALAVYLAEANYASTHIATATALGGGFLNAGNTANPYLQTALQEAGLIIQQDTGGIGSGEISVLMSHKTAMKIGRSREVREFQMQSPQASGLVSGDDAKLYGKYGIPPNLFGFPVIIEDAYANVGTKDNATTDVLSFIDTTLDNAVYLIVREGDLMKEEHDTGFNSWTQFTYEDLKAEARQDVWNRLTEFAVTDHFAAEVTAPETVFKIKNIFS